MGNFAGAIRHILALPHVEVKKEKVRAIRVEPNCVFINERPYDLAILPMNAPIGSLEFIYGGRRKRSFIRPRNWLSNRSEHIRLLLPSDIDYSGPIYSEASDPIFDRVGFIPGAHPYFVGRVHRQMKGKSPEKLLRDAPATKLAMKQAIAFDRQIYTQGRLDEDSVVELRNLASGTKLILLDGHDLLGGLESAVRQISRHFGTHEPTANWN